jgi:hypothetical protein
MQTLVTILRLFAVGLLGGLVVAEWMRFPRFRWLTPAGVLPLGVFISVLVAGQELVGRLDVATLAMAMAAAAAGATGTSAWARCTNGLPWVLLGGIGSLVGVWAAVPENSHVSVTAGVVVGVVGVSLMTGIPLRPRFGASLAVVVVWAAWVGAGSRLLALAGGLLCLGLAGTWGLGRLGRRLVGVQRGIAPGGWLVVTDSVLISAAARWVGSAPDATWDRVVVLLMAGVAVSATCLVTTAP